MVVGRGWCWWVVGGAASLNAGAAHLCRLDDEEVTPAPVPVPVPVPVPAPAPAPAPAP